MTAKNPKSKSRFGLMLLLKMLLVVAINIAGVFVMAKTFPLPKGQGLAYVAHPFFALVGGALAGVAYFVLSWVWKSRELLLLFLAIVASWFFSFLIFYTA